jgi:hypothetical protein
MNNFLVRRNAVMQSVYTFKMQNVIMQTVETKIYFSGLRIFRYFCPIKKNECLCRNFLSKQGEDKPK